MVFVGLAALDVGICWWLLGRLPLRFWVRIAGTAFFAFGTVFWYAAQLNSTWYQAHVAAIGLAMLATGFAIGGDRAAVHTEEAPTSGRDLLATIRRDGLAVDGRQFLIGLLFGLACTARLTMLFAAPFFVLVGSGGSWWRRGWSAGLGAALPVIVLFAYNLVTAGILHPAYAFLYEAEATYYPTLGYHLDWAIEDPRYIPQNLGIMLFSLPPFSPDTWPDSLRVTTDAFCTEPGAARGLFDVSCPLAVPNDIGMSVLLTSPAYLLAIPALGRFRTSRLVAGASIAVLLVAIVNLMHFSQGWVQFGYRFSNDFVPWAVILVALGAEAVARRGPVPSSSEASSSPRSSSTPGESRGAICSDGEAAHDRTPDRGRADRVRARGARTPAGTRLLGHGRAAGCGSADGHRPSDGLPDLRAPGWLASVLLQPFGEPAFRMNLFSAICVAVAAGVTVDLVRVLTRSRWIGAMAGLGLVLTPQVWAIGTHAEAHSLHLALVAILLRLLVGWEDRRRAPTDDPRRERADRWLVAATVVFGLAVGNHSLTLLLAPAIAAYVIAVEPGIVRRVRLVATCLAALAVTSWCISSCPAGRPVPRTARLRPTGHLGRVPLHRPRRAVPGQRRDPFGNLDIKLADLVDRTAREFGLLAVLVPFGFLVSAIRRPRYALLTGITVGLTVFFAASYDNAAIERYYLGPILIGWTCWRSWSRRSSTSSPGRAFSDALATGIRWSGHRRGRARGRDPPRSGAARRLRSRPRRGPQP